MWIESELYTENTKGSSFGGVHSPKFTPLHLIILSYPKHTNTENLYITNTLIWRVLLFSK